MTYKYFVLHESLSKIYILKKNYLRSSAIFLISWKLASVFCSDSLVSSRASGLSSSTGSPLKYNYLYSIVGIIYNITLYCNLLLLLRMSLEVQDILRIFWWVKDGSTSEIGCVELVTDPK